MGEDSATGSAFRLLSRGWTPGEGLGVADGLISGNKPEALPAPISELETPFRSGMGPSGTVVSATVAGEELGLAAGAEAGAAVTATVAAADGGVHFAEVRMLAVAISCTEVTELALDATGICACRLAGCWSDTEPTVHVAVPSPWAQPLVNVGFWLDGCALRATDTPAAEPFLAVTCTTKVALWPRATLACERWTLTHSSGWAAVLVGVGLVGVGLVGVGLADVGLADVGLVGVGLAAMRAVSDAEVWEDDGEADPESVAGGEPVPEDESAAVGDTGVLLGLLLGLGLVLDGGGLGELEEGDGEGFGVLVGVGVGVGVLVGVGVGVGVLVAGSTWHVVAALTPVPALVEVPRLGEAAGLSPLARAVPGSPASTPRVRKLPASTLSTATRTCASRMKIALSTLLIRVTVCSSWVRRRLGDGWV